MLEVVLNKVSKNYGNKIVLKNINFEIKTKERVALIGQNGCGKTTIFKMILNEEKPTTGDIFIKKNSKVGFLSQYPNESLSDEEDQIQQKLLESILNEEKSIKINNNNELPSNRTNQNNNVTTGVNSRLISNVGTGSYKNGNVIREFSDIEQEKIKEIFRQLFIFDVFPDNIIDLILNSLVISRFSGPAPV